jgi:hypothetical protein
MVQIIQSGPSAATLRQQALDNSINNIVGGLSNYQKQEAEAAKTLRQQALQEMQLTNDLKKEGYDVTSDQVAQSLKPQQAPGLFDKLMGNEVAPQEKIDLYGKRTPEWQAKQKLANDKALMESQSAEVDLSKKRKDLERQTQLDPLEIEAKKFQIDNDRTMSPIKKRAELLQLEKLQGDIATQPYQQQKLIAEAQKAQGEASALATNPAASKLAKMGGETQNKVGSIASGLKALSELKTSINKGVGPSYIDSNTPLIGKAFSDDSFTQNQRVLTEVVGRLQSGGAIQSDELESFNKMGPRPGDSKEQQIKKIEDQTTFLKNKLVAFGLKEEELRELGFDVGKAPVGFDQAKASRLAELRAKAKS